MTSGVTGSARPAAPSTWAPLRHGVFRALWTAQAASLVGTWAQTVGAQWFLTSGSGRPELVALVQTATSLPVLLLALPAGALADLVDRRRLLLVVQGSMVVVAAALAGVTFLGGLTPAVLLLFTAALGVGVALTAPAWQATVPELVPRDEVPSAAAMNGIAVNLARAIGPALGGVLVAAAGVGWTFAFNAATYVAFVVAVATRLPAADQRPEGERLAGAMRLAVDYVGHAPSMLRVLARTALWILPASALWALLPLVASDRLHLDSRGYGLLLAALGVGAVLSAAFLGRLRAATSAEALLTGAGAAYTLALLVLAVGRSTPMAVAVLLLAGAAWTAVLATFNATAQLLLPGWVRARALAVYLVVFQGGQAVGSVAWGALAGRASTDISLLVAAGVLLAGTATVPVLRLPDPSRLDPSPSAHWPEPHLELTPEEAAGPVLVVVEYRVRADSTDRFAALMRIVARSRRRTGARRWGLFRDGADPTRFLETYLVPSWAEHLRQHEQRLTVTDRTREEEARALLTEPPRPSHLFSP